MNPSIALVAKQLITYVVVGGLAAGLMQWNIGRQAKLAEEVGKFSQMVEQQSQETRRVTEELNDMVREAEVRETEHKRAMELVKQRLTAQREAVKKANQMTSELERLKRENTELKNWADVKHPDDVRMLINTAAGTTAGGDKD